MALRILALDLATKTGWAHSCGLSGVQDFHPRRGDSPGMKWLAFRGWLNRMREGAEFGWVAYEQAHHRGGAATHSAEGFVATLELWAQERCIELTSRHTSEIKRHATGKGNADKAAMLAAARTRWPDLEIVDDNQADALWLLDLVQDDLPY